MDNLLKLMQTSGKNLDNPIPIRQLSKESKVPYTTAHRIIKNNKELFIIDTAVGIDKVKVLDDIDKIELSPSYSAHDYDLGFNLKLLKKLGRLEKVTIFCVPQNIEKREALSELVKKIRIFVDSDKNS